MKILFKYTNQHSDEIYSNETLKDILALFAHGTAIHTQQSHKW